MGQGTGRKASSRDCRGKGTCLGTLFLPPQKEHRARDTAGDSPHSTAHAPILTLPPPALPFLGLQLAGLGKSSLRALPSRLFSSGDRGACPATHLCTSSCSRRPQLSPRGSFQQRPG